MLYYSSAGPAPSASLTAAPVPSVFTTQYYFTAQAADATSDWLATYTIQEVCTGDPASWRQPSTPPNFLTTVVTCESCATPLQTITCPADAADQTGSVSIWGNGVTATPAAEESSTAWQVWWGGALLTQSSSPTGTASPSSPTTYVQTADAATMWGNLALLSGALTVAIGWILWQ